MAHLKCLACKTRLYSSEGDPIGELCPVCGSPLVGSFHLFGPDLPVFAGDQGCKTRKM